MSSQTIDDLTIRDVFNKERDPLRNLKTIIKIFDTTSKSIWIEFEEFIITETLIKYLYEFIESFIASTHFDDAKMPFWLEGFYGSGKSHFSKIIGNLIMNINLINPNNEELNSIEFFINYILEKTRFISEESDELKEKVIKSLKIIPKRFNTKTLFINLAKYAKSESSIEEYFQSFTFALLREFNSLIGLSEEIITAEIEKSLIKEDLFDKFTAEVLNKKGKSWEEIRRSTARARSVFIEIYSSLMNCDELIAQEYRKGAKDQCKQKNIEDVLKEINEWCVTNLNLPESGIEGRIVIVLDEAGIFFSAVEARIGELLAAGEWVSNSINESRISMIFTAQQSLKKYIDETKKKKDYHKAEQRFKHWFLDKKNIKTVVVKRWLEKDKAAYGEKLKSFIEKNYPRIIDSTAFDTLTDPQREYIKPEREELFETYPFIPHQFPMMIQITQKLIEKKFVEEEYGGKTRSILSMTREILASKAPYSKIEHFIDEKLGNFVNLSQIYNSIIYTLRRKEEDQILLVEKTQILNENALELTDEEKKLPITFEDVSKSVFLLQFVDQIYSNDSNIAKATFSSIFHEKNIFFDKVKKIINFLKKKGYITYAKKEIQDEKGNKKEIWEYKLATQEEKDFTDFSFKYHVDENDIHETLLDFFKDGAGKNIISLRNQINLPSLIKQKQELKLKNAIKLKIKWFLDPDLDQILGQIEGNSINSVSICLLTNISLIKDNLEKLRKDLLILATKAYNKGQILLFFTPSLNQILDDLKYQNINLIDNLKQIFRINQGLKDYPIKNASIVQVFSQRKFDLEEEIKNQLMKEYNEGLIIYGIQKLVKLNQNNINSKILDSVREAYSQLNKYAYLGQIKVSANDIKSILTWDPKKKSKISKNLKKSSDNQIEDMPIFNQNADELKPNLCEQYNYINIEFQKIINKGVKEITGENLLNIFQKTPYAWRELTLIAIVAALIKKNEWDVIKSGQIKNSDDDDIIDAFIDSKSKYLKFKNLRFKIAEKLTQKQLNEAAFILKGLFNEHITTPTTESVNLIIKKSYGDLLNNINEVKTDIENLQFRGDLTTNINDLKGKSEQILEKNRKIFRIKSFLELFSNFTEKSTELKDFINLKNIIYRVKEVKSIKELSRYKFLREFLIRNLNEWFSVDKNLENLKLLKNKRDEYLELLNNPNILKNDNWVDLWNNASDLWKKYWNAYINLHKKLNEDINNGFEFIKEHKNYNKLDKKFLDEIMNIFNCNEDISITEEINSELFYCDKCKLLFSVLKVKENDLQSKVEEIYKILNKTTDVVVIIGKDPKKIKEEKQQKESWQKYQEIHLKIEEFLNKLESLKLLYKKEDNIKLINQTIETTLKDNKSFFENHKCTKEPVIWEIKNQQCKSCKLNYEELIDFQAKLEKIIGELIKKLIEEIKLPIQQDFTIDFSSEVKIKEILKEKIKDFNNFLLNFLERVEESKKEYIIKLIIDKGS